MGNEIDSSNQELIGAETRPSLTARILVTLCAATTMIGAYAADLNETHLFNPRWPPHARFHNAQTMLLATTLGACALLYAWRGDSKASHLRTAILFASLYWISNAGSIAFPGTAWVDPERAGQGEVLGIPAALAIGVVQLVLLAVAIVLSRTRSEAPIDAPNGADGNNHSELKQRIGA